MLEPPINQQLPSDIIPIIIEECIEGSKGDALRFLHISKDMMLWVGPRFYSNVVLRTSKQVASFIAAVNGEYHYSKPSQHVQSLWILCTHISATRGLRDVLLKCPNLKHIAYDGASVPFPVIRSRSILPERLSRLSVCSPMLWQVEDHIAGTPIPYECLTHLHFICPSQSTYDFVGAHAKDLTALTHLRIDIMSPTLAKDGPCRQDRSQLALVSLLSRIGLLQKLFVRIPSLREIVVKSDIAHPILPFLTKPLETQADLRKIAFEYPGSDGANKLKPEGVNGFKLPVDPISAWHWRACQSLDEASRRWN